MRRLVPFLAIQLLAVACNQDYSIEPAPDDNDDPGDTAVQDPSEPIADAGADQEVSPLTNVALSGIGSYDPGNLAITQYQWTMVQVPPGSTALLENAASVNPSFFADLAGEYIIELSVMNEDGVWDTTPDRVTINAKPLQGFYVQLSWDAASDLDLHLLDSGSSLWDDPGDACYCNTNPDWGQIGNSIDDPSLDWDAIDGFGPETITIQSPVSGSYTMEAHYYGQFGSTTCSGACPASHARADIYVDGNLFKTVTNTLTSNGQVWTIGTLSWPSGAFTETNSIGYTSETSCSFW